MIGKLFIAGVTFAIFLTSTNALVCLSCDRAVNITDCLSQSAACKDNEEECFLDKTILPDLTAVFTAGCRAKVVCDLIGSAASSGKRSIAKRDNVACAQCCKTAPDNSTGIPCNGYLCNQKPATPGKTCAICDRTGNVTSCAVSQQCPKNEICQVKMIVSGGSLVYELGCEQITQCDKVLQAYKESHGGGSGGGSGSAKTTPGTGKRDHGDIEICSACCDTRNCNKGDCTALRKVQVCNDKSVCGP